MKVKLITKTDGKGLWSNKNKTVGIKEILVDEPVLKDEESDHRWSSLRVAFRVKDWDIWKHGLIYTDNTWLREFKKGLRGLGFSVKAVKDVNYSEQGRQGIDFVDLDIGEDFIACWEKLTGKNLEIDIV